MSLESFSLGDYSCAENLYPTPSCNDYDYRKVTPRVIEPSVETVVSELISQWYDESAYLSSPDVMRTLDSYKKIVRLGRLALPYIIGEIEKRPSLLMMAAHDITGENPVSEAIRGDIRAMMGAWVGWYQKSRRDWL